MATTKKAAPKAKRVKPKVNPLKPKKKKIAVSGGGQNLKKYKRA